MSTVVGWIGVGAMGKPMIARVAAAGMAVKAFDTDPSRLAGLDTVGVQPVTSIHEAAREADILVLMVATPDQGDAALFGSGGAAEILTAGTTVIVAATVGPSKVTQWSLTLADNDIVVVDAPVSGGTTRAATGELIAMVGGTEQAVSHVQPLLAAISNRVTRVGNSPGDGQRMKLVNQLLCGVHIAVAAEALGFAEALGLDAAAAWSIIHQGAAASFMFEDRGQRMIAGAFEDVRSAIDIFVKDMGLVAETAHGVAYPTPIAASAEQLYLAARRAGFGRLDDSIVIQIARGLAEHR